MRDAKSAVEEAGKQVPVGKRAETIPGPVSDVLQGEEVGSVSSHLNV